MLKKTKVANLLLLDYSFLFILLTLIIVGVSMLVVVLSGTMAKSEPETMYTASQVMRNDLATIDTTDIVNHGGMNFILAAEKKRSNLVIIGCLQMLRQVTGFCGFIHSNENSIFDVIEASINWY